MSRLKDIYSVLVEATKRLDQLRDMGLRTWVEEIAAIHLLQVQAQALIDMVVLLASELGYRPRTPRDAARNLVNEGLLTREELEFIRRVVAFRNIVVHNYVRVDLGVVRRVVEEGQYKRVALIAGKLLEEAVRRGVDP